CLWPPAILGGDASAQVGDAHFRAGFQFGENIRQAAAFPTFQRGDKFIRRGGMRGGPRDREHRQKPPSTNTSPHIRQAYLRRNSPTSLHETSSVKARGQKPKTGSWSHGECLGGGYGRRCLDQGFFLVRDSRNPCPSQDFQ